MRRCEKNHESTAISTKAHKAISLSLQCFQVTNGINNHSGHRGSCAPPLPFLQRNSPVNCGPCLLSPWRRERAWNGPPPREESEVAIAAASDSGSARLHFHVGFEAAECEREYERKSWKIEKAFLVKGSRLCQHPEDSVEFWVVRNPNGFLKFSPQKK